MKKIIAILIFISVSANASDFCDGYQSGYKAGFCDGKSGCFEPFPPFCPFPGFGETTFKHGYNRGFKKGLFEQ